MHICGRYGFREVLCTVCQSKLIEVLSPTVKDGRVISLIHKYLNAGVISKGIIEKTGVGMPQGGPLSPLLSNIMPYTEKKLFLKVNREKTKVAHLGKVKYLGYSLYDTKENVSLEYTQNQ